MSKPTLKYGEGKPTYEATRFVEVFGYKEAVELCNQLIMASIFFVMEPMPECVYRFYVKEECARPLPVMATASTKLVAINNLQEKKDVPFSGAL
jgi:hypothetical protein